MANDPNSVALFESFFDNDDEWVDVFGDEELPSRGRNSSEMGSGIEADMTPNNELELENIVTQLVQDEGVSPDEVLKIVNDVLADIRSNPGIPIYEGKKIKQE